MKSALHGHLLPSDNWLSPGPRRSTMRAAATPDWLMHYQADRPRVAFRHTIPFGAHQPAISSFLRNVWTNIALCAGRVRCQRSSISMIQTESW